MPELLFEGEGEGEEVICLSDLSNSRFSLRMQIDVIRRIGSLYFCSRTTDSFCFADIYMEFDVERTNFLVRSIRKQEERKEFTFVCSSRVLCKINGLAEM